MKFTYADGQGFTVGRIQIEDDGSALVSVGANVEPADAEAYAREEVVLLVRVNDSRQRTVAQIEIEALNRACAIVQAAGQALSDQIHVYPEAK